MGDVLTAVGLIALVLVLIFLAPAIVAWSLGALFGLAFWPSWWLAFGAGLLLGGSSAVGK